MSTTDLLVIAGGLAAIAWVNWYFFVAASGRSATAVATGDAQEARILVQGGYDPAIVRLVSHRPARLIFDRQEESGCSEEVVIPDFSIRRYLPAFDQTAVELPAADAGSYEFTCGMGMLHGRIIVEDEA